jgi:hypothetical protein
MTYFVDVYGTLIDGATDTPYGDTAEFLRMLGNEAILISSADDKGPIEAALTGIPRLTIILTNNQLKGEFLAEHPHLVTASTLFVDDSPSQLASVSERFPDVRIFEMRRDGKDGDGRWPVVHSLSELP